MALQHPGPPCRNSTGADLTQSGDHRHRSKNAHHPEPKNKTATLAGCLKPGLPPQVSQPTLARMWKRPPTMSTTRLLPLVLAILTSAEAGNFTVDVLTKNNSSASASGHGDLQPWGAFGLGCGINWKEDASFGGGVQTGTATFGLGGGWTIFANNTMTIGLGIGIGKQSANVHVDASADGVVEVVIGSSGALSCAGVGDGADEAKIRCVANNKT